MAKPTSTKLALAIVGILIVAGVGYGGLMLWRNTENAENRDENSISEEERAQPENPVIEVSSPLGEPKDTAIDASDWKLYRNEEFGFEVKYPVDWEASTGCAPPSVSVPSTLIIRFCETKTYADQFPGNAYVDILVEPNPGEEKPTPEWYKGVRTPQAPSERDDNIKAEETTFKGLRALQVGRGRIYFAKGSNMFEIRSNIHGTIDEEFAKHVEYVFDQVLISFHFLVSP